MNWSDSGIQYRIYQGPWARGPCQDEAHVCQFPFSWATGPNLKQPVSISKNSKGYDCNKGPTCWQKGSLKSILPKISARCLGPSQAIFPWAKTYFLFMSLVCQWAQFTWFGPLLLSTQGGQIGDGLVCLTGNVSHHCCFGDVNSVSKRTADK